MKKETQEQKDIREAIVDWLSTHRLMQGEFEILKRYVRQFYDISLYDITEEALVSLWKKSSENKALRMGAYCMEDFWDWEEIDIATIELETECCEEDEGCETPFNIIEGNSYTYRFTDNASFVNSQDKTDITQYKAPFTYTISGIPEKLVLTYELKESERINNKTK